MRLNAEVTDDGPDVPEWWDEVDHVEILHKRVGVSMSTFTNEDGELLEEYEDLLGDFDLENVNSVHFEKGDELPPEIAATCWSAFSDRLAALDEDDERLDTQHSNERLGFSTAVTSGQRRL